MLILNHLKQLREFKEGDLYDRVTHISRKLNAMNPHLEKPIIYKNEEGVKKHINPSDVVCVVSKKHKGSHNSLAELNLADGSSVFIKRTSGEISQHSPFFCVIRRGLVINLKYRQLFKFITKKTEESQRSKSAYIKVPRAFLEINGTRIEISGNSVKTAKGLLNA